MKLATMFTMHAFQGDGRLSLAFLTNKQPTAAAALHAAANKENMEC